MMKEMTLNKSEIYESDGLLAEAADRATSKGFHFVSVHGRVFKVESGRAQGSSLGLCRIRNVSLVG
ncbi:MAG TPA: hypothetical protein VGK67_14195 [Myxococcales bacterium]|jgi:hypothetical protein